jgi:hypothetical protein
MHYTPFSLSIPSEALLFPQFQACLFPRGLEAGCLKDECVSIYSRLGDMIHHESSDSPQQVAE